VQSDRDFADAFDAAFARLRETVEAACSSAEEWPEQVAAGVAAAIEFPISDPAAARTLTSDAFAYGPYGAQRHRQLIEHFVPALAHGRDRRPPGEPLPALTEEALIGGIAEVVAERLRVGEPEELHLLKPQLVALVLIPYLGPEEARRIAGN
jgi:hypothetical protein